MQPTKLTVLAVAMGRPSSLHSAELTALTVLALGWVDPVPHTAQNSQRSQFWLWDGSTQFPPQRRTQSAHSSGCGMGRPSSSHSAELTALTVLAVGWVDPVPSHSAELRALTVLAVGWVDPVPHTAQNSQRSQFWLWDGSTQFLTQRRTQSAHSSGCGMGRPSSSHSAELTALTVLAVGWVDPVPHTAQNSERSQFWLWDGSTQFLTQRRTQSAHSSGCGMGRPSSSHCAELTALTVLAVGMGRPSSSHSAELTALTVLAVVRVDPVAPHSADLRELTVLTVGRVDPVQRRSHSAHSTGCGEGRLSCLHSADLRALAVGRVDPVPHTAQNSERSQYWLWDGSTQFLTQRRTQNAHSTGCGMGRPSSPNSAELRALTVLAVGRVDPVQRRFTAITVLAVRWVDPVQRRSHSAHRTGCGMGRTSSTQRRSQSAHSTDCGEGRPSSIQR